MALYVIIGTSFGEDNFSDLKRMFVLLNVLYIRQNNVINIFKWVFLWNGWLIFLIATISHVGIWDRKKIIIKHWQYW